jgi:succinate dehydrogenase / fumarate reductase cytochrome b subunit
MASRSVRFSLIKWWVAASAVWRPVRESELSESQSTASQSFADRHYFVIRRLHSLFGLVPVGVFVLFHLLANSSILAPGDRGAEFQKSVDQIHSLGPLVVPLEIVGIFLPLLFHSLLGFQIVFNSSSNAQQYRFGSNIRYTLQRTSGIIAFLFIFYHVWQMHWFGKPFGGGSFDPHNAPVTAAQAMQSAAWVAPLYVLGVIASVYHLANGIWTALITWGITIRPATQRMSGFVCAVFGVLLCLVGLGAVVGFRTFDVGAPTTVTSAPTTESVASAP